MSGREIAIHVAVALAVIGTFSHPRARAEQGPAASPSVPQEVLAFYYPWYGTPEGPGGAGRTVHWGRIDAANYDIAASTHYPALGAYDSHDPAVIDQHCRWAKTSHIDGFIVSWWGHGDYTDRAMPAILDACRRHGLRRASTTRRSHNRGRRRPPHRISSKCSRNTAATKPI